MNYRFIGYLTTSSFNVHWIYAVEFIRKIIRVYSCIKLGFNVIPEVIFCRFRLKRLSKSRKTSVRIAHISPGRVLNVRVTKMLDLLR